MAACSEARVSGTGETMTGLGVGRQYFFSNDRIVEIYWGAGPGSGGRGLRLVDEPEGRSLDVPLPLSSIH